MLHVTGVLPVGDVDLNCGAPFVAVELNCPAFEPFYPLAWQLGDDNRTLKRIPGPTIRIDRDNRAIYYVVVLDLGVITILADHPIDGCRRPVIQGVPTCDVAPWFDESLGKYGVKKPPMYETGPWGSYLVGDDLIISMGAAFDPKFICRAGQFDFVVDSNDEIVAFVVRGVDDRFREFILARKQ